MLSSFFKIIFSFSNAIFSYLLINTGYIDFKNPQIKAYWQPPDFVFGIVWSILYLLFGVINLRILNSKKNFANKTLFMIETLLESVVMNAWVVVTGSNYFPDIIKYSIGAVILIYLNLLCHLTRKNDIYDLDKTSYYLYLPYCIWISFALLLNIQIVHKLFT